MKMVHDRYHRAQSSPKIEDVPLVKLNNRLAKQDDILSVFIRQWYQLGADA
jgi:hypothetical protein